MSAPRLTRRLRLEELRLTPDGAGGLSRAWEELGSLWAELRPGTARLELQDGLARAEVSLRIITRFAAPHSPQRPLPGQRFREGGRVWAILAVSEGLPDARYLTAHVQEEIPA